MSLFPPFFGAHTFTAMWGVPPGLGGDADGSQWVDRSNRLLNFAVVEGNSIPFPVTTARLDDVALGYYKYLFVRWPSYSLADSTVIPAGAAFLQENQSFTFPPIPLGLNVGNTIQEP